MVALLYFVAIAVGFVVFIWASCVHESLAEREYNESHPPISDEEFVRRCSAPISLEVAAKVRQTISDIFGIDYERIYPDTNLVKLDNMW